jgi:hypothetical protein
VSETIKGKPPMGDNGRRCFATESESVRISANVNKRKILVFAHVPPPHHGQSVMMQVLLEGLWAERKNPGLVSPGFGK